MKLYSLFYPVVRIRNAGFYERFEETINAKVENIVVKPKRQIRNIIVPADFYILNDDEITPIRLENIETLYADVKIIIDTRDDYGFLTRLTIINKLFDSTIEDKERLIMTIVRAFRPEHIDFIEKAKEVIQKYKESMDPLDFKYMGSPDIAKILEEIFTITQYYYDPEREIDDEFEECIVHIEELNNKTGYDYRLQYRHTKVLFTYREVLIIRKKTFPLKQRSDSRSS